MRVVLGIQQRECCFAQECEDTSEVNIFVLKMS